MKRKNDVSYHMTWETQDHDFTCSCKNAPIPMASVLHSHDGYEIYLFLSGEIRIIFENDNRIMKRGDLLLIPRMSFILQYRSVAVPTAASSSTSRNPTCRKKGPAYDHFADCFYQSDSSRLNLLHLNETQIARYCDYARSLDQTLREPSSAYGRDFLAEALLTTILVFIGRIADSSSRLEARQTPPPTITATFRYIDDHLSESLLLEDIAKQVHLNPVYLTRIFKSYTGMPIQQYIIEKRLTQAKKLLRMGKPPIDVCFLCRFNNYSNFSRTFSKHLKLSPKQYQISTRASFSTRDSSEQM